MWHTEKLGSMICEEFSWTVIMNYKKQKNYLKRQSCCYEMIDRPSHNSLGYIDLGYD